MFLFLVLFSTTWRRDKSFIVLGCHNDMLWGQLSCQMRSPLTSNCLDICSLEKRTPASWLKLKRAVLRSQFSHKCSLLEKWKSVIYSLSVNLKCWTMRNYYRGSPDSTNFAQPGNRTIEKIVLSGDWFDTKITVYDFWIFKVPYFSSFSLIKAPFFS